MQDRYVGDIGDFVKFAILRALSADGRRLGVFWWLYPNETHNSDGKHRQYLTRPQHWRFFDEELFDKLTSINHCGVRNVQALEKAGLLRDARYYSELLPTNLSPSDRPAARQSWLVTGMKGTESCDLLFLDPDNGVASINVKPTQKRAGKSVLLEDLHTLQRPGRALVVYHHQSRYPGGHDAEFYALADRLKSSGFRVSGALRAKSWSPRLFFIIDGDDALCARAKQLVEQWGDKMRWISAAQ